MLRFNKALVIWAVFILMPLFSFGQHCDLKFGGHILDENEGIPIPFTNIYIMEEGVGAVTNEKGLFEFVNLCHGNYIIKISHVGYETKQIKIHLYKDEYRAIFLSKDSKVIDEVVIESEKEDDNIQIKKSVSKSKISSEANKNLSDVLQNITGVSVLKTGSGISKPIIHGLYGNRIIILNNGIAQSGQQWGNDHSPEIDPFAANNLSVIKGVSALEFGGNSLGGAVLVEIDRIKDDPFLHGELNYIFQTNGLGHTLNAKMEKNDNWAAWRISGTFKAIGHTETPDYFLTNSGKKENNLAVQLDKNISKKWNASLYYSLFDTEIGILRGSHIGNLTDLEQAIGRNEPFFTNDEFSHDIQAPKQEVQHHLLKFESTHFFNKNQTINFTYGGQINNRKEFDIRRSGRSDIPALSLKQYSHFFEGSYKNSFSENHFLKTGLQFNFVDNENNPETGILPLIPDYESYQYSAFAIFQNKNEKLSYELGGRFDLKEIDVVAISRTTPRTIERFNHNFQNYSISAGANYKISNLLKVNLNGGYVLRSPEVNELHSFGLHQGVSGIEEGTLDLNNEKSLKFILSADWDVRSNLFFQALGYYQNINDYIFLQPQQEFRLTIRGAFPVFIYEQTDAEIYGTDLFLTYEPINRIKLVSKYAFVKGNDSTNDIPLVNMPSNNLSASLTYSLDNFGSFKNNHLTINSRYVFKQNNLFEEQDFLPPPNGYLILGLELGTNFSFNQSILKFSLIVENLLDKSYRDYLNRQRYFADDLGRNINLRVNYSF